MHQFSKKRRPQASFKRLRTPSFLFFVDQKHRLCACFAYILGICNYKVRKYAFW